MFTSFFQSGAKPQNFSVSKGSVKVVNSSEAFWVKYPTSDAAYVRCSSSGGRLDVNVTKDNVPVTVNIHGLSGCSVNLDAGSMEVNDVCRSSNMTVGAGAMTVHASRSSFGTVNARVDAGALNNHSDLTVTSQTPSGGFGSAFGFGGFGSGGFGSGSVGSTISLVGDLDGYIADFHVGGGTFNI